MTINRIIATILASSVATAPAVDAIAQEGSKETTQTQESSGRRYSEITEDYYKRLDDYIVEFEGKDVRFTDLGMRIKDKTVSLQGSFDNLDFVILQSGSGFRASIHNKNHVEYTSNTSEECPIPKALLELLNQQFLNEKTVESLKKDKERIIPVLRNIDLEKLGAELEAFVKEECYGDKNKGHPKTDQCHLARMECYVESAKTIFDRHYFDANKKLKEGGSVTKRETRGGLKHPFKNSFADHVAQYGVFKGDKGDVHYLEIREPQLKRRTFTYSLYPNGKSFVELWTPIERKSREMWVHATVRLDYQGLIEETKKVESGGKDNKRWEGRVNAFNAKRLYDTGRRHMDNLRQRNYHNKVPQRK